jgi:hypothetical protein
VNDFCGVCCEDVALGMDAQLCPPCGVVVCMSCEEQHEAWHEAREKGERMMRQERQHVADMRRLHDAWTKKQAAK